MVAVGVFKGTPSHAGRWRTNKFDFAGGRQAVKLASAG